MRLKIHMIKTAVNYIPMSWKNSVVISGFSHNSRITSFFSLLFWFYFYGHDYNDYCTFKFWTKTFNEKKSYISLKRNDRLRFAMTSPLSFQLFLDKVSFNIRFEKYIRRKWLAASKCSNEEIKAFVDAHKTIIAKPSTDFGGHGIIRLTTESGDLPYEKLKQENYILEECIENVESIKCLAPGSLNTIRIVTVLDKNKDLHIIAALLRMGNGSGFKDNYHDGGLACPIDMEKGVLNGIAYGMECVEYDRHPFSKISFDGYKVEHFEDCLKMISKIAKEETGARYVGWDIAVTPNGIELLEGNIPPGEDITQIAAGRGLWKEITDLI